MQYLACTEVDEATGSCTTVVLVDPPSLFQPELTVQEGREIGQSIFLALVTVAVFKFIRRAA